MQLSLFSVQKSGLVINETMQKRQIYLRLQLKEATATERELQINLKSCLVVYFITNIILRARRLVSLLVYRSSFGKLNIFA